MDITEVLAVLWELEELKKDTVVTKSILSTAKSLVVLDDKEKSETLVCLTTKLRWCYTSMLERVIRYKLVATKKNKLWVLLHTQGN